MVQGQGKSEVEGSKDKWVVVPIHPAEPRIHVPPVTFFIIDVTQGGFDVGVLQFRPNVVDLVGCCGDFLGVGNAVKFAEVAGTQFEVKAPGLIKYQRFVILQFERMAPRR